jgi:hypothetical protein
MTSTKTTTLDLGAVQGCVTLPAALLRLATEAARQVLAEGHAQEFCGEAVSWLTDSEMVKACLPHFPLTSVQALGLEPDIARARVYGTYGVDSHIDGDGLVCILVLENQGLKFKQKRQTHVTNTGEWFIFDDRLPHLVKESKNSGAYIFLHVPVHAA